MLRGKVQIGLPVQTGYDGGRIVAHRGVILICLIRKIVDFIPDIGDVLALFPQVNGDEAGLVENQGRNIVLPVQ